MNGGNGDGLVGDECRGCLDDWPLSPLSGTTHVRYTYPEPDARADGQWTRMELIPCTRRLRALRSAA